MEQLVRRMWEHFTIKKSVEQISLGRCGKRKVSDWQKESPYKEELELVLHGSDPSSGGFLMRRAYHTGRSGDWEIFKEEFRNDDKLSVWASFKVTECYDEAEAEDGGRMSIAQKILRERTGFPRSIMAPNDGVGGVTSSYVCPHCHCFPLEDCIWWVSFWAWKGSV